MYRKIGILCASDTELDPVLKLLTEKKVTEKAMLRFCEGKIGDREVAAVYSGVCKVNAAVAVQLMIDLFQVDAVINGGTAGGMDPKLRIFDTVISCQSAYHDVAEDILTEFHPWMESVFFPADERLLKAAKKYGAEGKHPVFFGTMVSGEQFIEEENREEINAAFHPLSVDMETAAMAHVCYVNRIPFLAVRTITDTADHSGIAHFEENCERASVISAEVIQGILQAECCEP